MATVHCAACGHSRKVPEKNIGRKVACPSCGAPVIVEPDADELQLDDVIGEAQAVTHSAAPPVPVSAEDLLEHAEDEPSHIFQGNFIKNAVSGIISGFLAIFFCLAVALLIFSSGPHPIHFSHALSITLISATIVGLVVAARSGVAFALAGPESMVAVIIFLFISGIHASMPDGTSLQEVHTTTTAALMLTTLLSGICLWLIGGMNAGDWIRFIPIQAVGGMVAGVGFLILKFALAHTTGCTGEGFDLIFSLLSREHCQQWFPAAGFGLFLFFTLRFIKHRAAIFILLLLGVAGTHAALYGFGLDFEAARETGWLFETFRQDEFWHLYDRGLIEYVNVPAILDNMGYVAALIGIIAAGTMLKVTELEIVLGREIDLSREFMGLGMGNLLSGFAGGLPGSLVLSRSLANKTLGAAGAVSGIISALICCGALFSVHYFVPFIPKLVPSGLLIYLGLSLIWRWLIETRTQFTHKGDYSLLVLIFLLTCSLGLLAGVGIGAGLAMLVTAGRYGSMSVIKHEVSGATFHSNVDRAASQFKVLKEKGDAIHAITLQGFIFLGTTSGLLRRIRARLLDREKNALRFLLLDFTFIGGLDSSVALSFTKLQQMARKYGFMLIFTNMPFELEEQLKKVGCVLNDPEHHSFTVTSLDYAMEWAEDHILDEADALTVDQQSLRELLDPIFPEPHYIPALMKVLKKVTVKRGKAVFRQGDVSDAMYFIESGMVNVQLELDGGKVLRLKKMGPGTAFGEMGIYTSAPRSASIVAAEDCVLYRLSTNVLHKLQAKAPHFTAAIHRFIVNLLSERVADANAKVRDLLA